MHPARRFRGIPVAKNPRSTYTSQLADRMSALRNASEDEIRQSPDAVAAAARRAAAGMVLVVGVAQEADADRPIRAIAVAGAINRGRLAIAPQDSPRVGCLRRRLRSVGAGAAAVGLRLGRGQAARA